jgi:hypothetical protein
MNFEAIHYNLICYKLYIRLINYQIDSIFKDSFNKIYKLVNYHKFCLIPEFHSFIICVLIIFRIHLILNVLKVYSTSCTLWQNYSKYPFFRKMITTISERLVPYNLILQKLHLIMDKQILALSNMIYFFNSPHYFHHIFLYFKLFLKHI